MAALEELSKSLNSEFEKALNENKELSRKLKELL